MVALVEPPAACPQAVRVPTPHYNAAHGLHLSHLPHLRGFHIPHPPFSRGKVLNRPRSAELLAPVHVSPSLPSVRTASILPELSSANMDIDIPAPPPKNASMFPASEPAQVNCVPPPPADVLYGSEALPAAPCVPPSNEDLLCAVHFREEILYMWQTGEVGDDAMAEAIRYEHRIIDATQPARWSGDLARRVTALEDEVQMLRRALTRTHSISAKRENFYSRPLGPFQEVPFPSGFWPWNNTVIAMISDGDLVTLPPLISDDSVRQLDTLELHVYYHGYYPQEEEGELDPSEEIRFVQEAAVLEAIGRGDVV